MFGCRRGEKRTGVKQMKLYDSRQAPNPRRTRIFLAEKGIALPTEQVDIMAMQHKTPEYAAINFFSNVAAVFRHLHPAMKELEVPQVPAYAEAMRPRAIWFLELLDKELATREFIASERYSVADITTLVTVDFMKPARLAMPENAVNVKRWHAAVSSRPSAKA